MGALPDNQATADRRAGANRLSAWAEEAEEVTAESVGAADPALAVQEVLHTHWWFTEHYRVNRTFR